MCWAYLGGTYITWCWEKQQHLVFPRAWNATLGFQTHLSNCCRRSFPGLFYILSHSPRLSPFPMVSSSSVCLPGVSESCSSIAFLLLFRNAKASLLSLKTVLDLTSYLRKSLPASPHLSDRLSRRLLSKHVVLVWQCSLAHSHTTEGWKPLSSIF